MDRELAEERPVGIPHGDEFLTGSLGIPQRPRGVVIVANDAGCARHVPALRALAAQLRSEDFATLLVDVARLEGDGDGPDELAMRIDSARAWIQNGNLRSLPQVLLGLGEAAPAALLSAAARPALLAVVACGPHPDLAGIALDMVEAPALLIAHSGQLTDIGPHVRALGRLHGERDLAVLHDQADPVKHAVDVARAVAAFVAPGHVRHAA